ncbi:hypothetical protein ACN27E_05290 [Mycobacterium sp. WMMD1722]|uniref:hypothetical protein n=1 Tax=Mycobacterium sp. WMMD1722 TaxID=3404117 RepID=UPI003BF5729E
MNSRGITVAATSAIAVIAMTAGGCGYRMGAVPADGVSAVASVTATAAASVRTGADVREPQAGVASIDVDRAVVPNAQGDPACASPVAWGRQPQGPGVLVSVQALRPASVTVLVRTQSGADVAERAVVDGDDLRLFEFPDVGFDVVREVLIMTTTARCFAVADPVTFR